MAFCNYNNIFWYSCYTGIYGKNNPIVCLIHYKSSLCKAFRCICCVNLCYRLDKMANSLRRQGIPRFQGGVDGDEEEQALIPSLIRCVSVVIFSLPSAPNL